MHLLEVGVLQETQFRHQLGLQLRVLLQVDLLVHTPLPLLPIQILLFFVKELLFVVHELELFIVFQVRNEIFIDRAFSAFILLLSTFIIIVILVIIGVRKTLPLRLAPSVLLPSRVRGTVNSLASSPSHLRIPPFDVTAHPWL